MKHASVSSTVQGGGAELAQGLFDDFIGTGKQIKA